jgi:hypothetical protein
VLQLKQSEATAGRRRLPVYLVDDTDGKTPETGVTFTAGDIRISQNGGAEANHAGTIAEVGGGLYYYEATAGELATLGFLSVRVIKTGVRTFVAMAQVQLHDPYGAAGGGGPTAVEIADALLTRDWTAVSGEAARSVLNALRFLRNKWSIAGSTLTVTKEDDAATAWTAALTTVAAAQGVSGADPT